MKTLLKTTIAIAALAAFTVNANASDFIDPIEAEIMGMTSFIGEPDMLLDIAEPKPASIGVARLDNGRLIAAPHGELEDWHFLDKRTQESFTPISAGAYLKNVPEIAYGDHDSTNKIDEIRLTAADAGLDYVVVYTVGRGAEWASLGGPALAESGLAAPLSSAIFRNASGKAVLVETRTGKVQGAVISDETEFGVGDLTDQVQDMVTGLVSSQYPKA